MADPQATMRGVSIVLDTQQLQAQLQRMLTDSQTPHKGLLSTCLDDRLRRSLVGDQLDALVGTSKEVSEPNAGLVAGLILLLHLCNPTRYTADIAAAACAALAAVVADGSSMHPHLSPEVRYIADHMTGAHSHQLAAAMQHDRVAAQVARLRPDAVAVLAAGAFRISNASGDTPQQIVRENAELFEVLQASAVQAATYVCRQPEARSAERLTEVNLGAVLLEKAAFQRRAEAGAVLRAAVEIQALCLASRPGGGTAEALPADRLHSLSLSMVRASATAQEAARQLLLEQCDDQHSDAKRRPAAEATLQSIVHLCRWVCEPLQGRFPTQQVADKQADHALELLGKALGSNSSGSHGKGGSSRSSGSSLNAAAVAASGSVQLQRSAAALADMLAATATLRATLGMAWQLAPVARLLVYMCGCSSPGSSGAHAHGSGGASGSDGGSSSGGNSSSSSFPVTVACLHSRPGQRLLKTRVDAPAKLLHVVFFLFDAEHDAPFSKMLQIESRDERLASFLGAFAQVVDDMAALLSASALQLLGGCRDPAVAWEALQRLDSGGALAALIATLQLPSRLTRASAGAPPAAAGNRQWQPCNGGLSSGCGLVVQAAVAAVAVGELALCRPLPAVGPAQPASGGTAPSQATAESGDAAAAGHTAAPAADAAAATAAGAAPTDMAAGSRETAAAAGSEPAGSAILMRLMQCSLALGSHADRITHETADARATELAEIEEDELAAGRKGPKSADSKQRRAQHRAVKAEVQAAQAASARLLATAAAGLAGLTAAAAAAEQADRAQRSAGATGQPRDKAAVDQRVMDRKAMYSLLQQSTNLAMSALDAASRMPGFAADFIESGCAILAGVAVATGLPKDTKALWRDSRADLQRLLRPADARRLAPMFQQVDEAMQGTLSNVVPSAAGLQAQREVADLAAGRSTASAAAAAEAAAAELLEEEQSSTAATGSGRRHGSGGAQQPPGPKSKAKRARQKAAKAAA